MPTTTYTTTTKTNVGGEIKSIVTRTSYNPMTSSPIPSGGGSGHTRQTSVSPFPFNTGNISGPATTRNIYSVPDDYTSGPLKDIPINNTRLQNAAASKLSSEFTMSASEYARTHPGVNPYSRAAVDRPSVTTYTKVTRDEQGNIISGETMRPGWTPASEGYTRNPFNLSGEEWVKPAQKPNFMSPGEFVIKPINPGISSNISMLTAPIRQNEETIRSMTMNRSISQAEVDFATGAVAGGLTAGPVGALAGGLGSMAFSPLIREEGARITAKYQAENPESKFIYPTLFQGNKAMNMSQVVGGVWEMGAGALMFKGVGEVTGAAATPLMKAGLVAKSEETGMLIENVGVRNAAGKTTLESEVLGRTKYEVPLYRVNKEFKFNTGEGEYLKSTITPTEPGISESITTGKLNIMDIAKNEKFVNPREISVTSFGGSKEITSIPVKPMVTGEGIPNLKTEVTISKESSVNFVEGKEKIGGGFIDFFESEGKSGSMKPYSEMNTRGGIQTQRTTSFVKPNMDVYIGRGELTGKGFDTKFNFVSFIGRMGEKEASKPIGFRPYSIKPIDEDFKPFDVKISAPKSEGSVLQIPKMSAKEVPKFDVTGLQTTLSKEVEQGISKEISRSTSRMYLGGLMSEPLLKAKSSPQILIPMEMAKTKVSTKSSSFAQSILGTTPTTERAYNNKQNMAPQYTIQSVSTTPTTILGAVSKTTTSSKTTTDIIPNTIFGNYPVIPGTPPKGGGFGFPIPAGGGVGGSGEGGGLFRNLVRSKKFRRPIRDPASFLGLNIFGGKKKK